MLLCFHLKVYILNNVNKHQIDLLASYYLFTNAYYEDHNTKPYPPKYNYNYRHVVFLTFI